MIVKIYAMDIMWEQVEEVYSIRLKKGWGTIINIKVKFRMHGADSKVLRNIEARRQANINKERLE